MAIFDQLLCCWPSWMAAITRNHKNGYLGSTIKDRDEILHSKKFFLFFPKVENI